jgi:hypothetical protein
MPMSRLMAGGPPEPFFRLAALRGAARREGPRPLRIPAKCQEPAGVAHWGDSPCGRPRANGAACPGFLGEGRDRARPSHFGYISAFAAFWVCSRDPGVFAMSRGASRGGAKGGGGGGRKRGPLPPGREGASLAVSGRIASPTASSPRRASDPCRGRGGAAW